MMEFVFVFWFLDPKSITWKSHALFDAEDFHDAYRQYTVFISFHYPEEMGYHIVNAKAAKAGTGKWRWLMGKPFLEFKENRKSYKKARFIKMCSREANKMIANWHKHPYARPTLMTLEFA